jgi:hypothetical protein
MLLLFMRGDCVKYLFLDILFLDYKIIYVVTVYAGGLCQVLRLITVLTSEERRHTLQIGVSIGVIGRRVCGPLVLLSVLDCRVSMTVIQQSVQFADTCCNTIQFIYAVLLC